MSDGFFSRWSQRKEAVRKGKELPPEPLPSPQPSSASGRGSEAGELPLPLAGEGGGEGAASEPAPTLEDAQALTQDSDFTRFVKPDVAPEVKNAALKKLFSDPHFNTMDGLDTYIDDYGKPDPLPESMLKQLASAKFLGLFDEPGEKTPLAGSTAGEGSPAVAQSGLCNELPGPADASMPSAAGPAHADPDLRLQQDNAPGPEGPGERAA